MNPQVDSIIEIIRQVLGNLVRTYNLQETYVDENYPWIGLLAAAAFDVRSTHHIIKGEVPGQIVFGQYIILPIKHVADWRYMCQRKQAQIEKYSIHKNST